MHNNAPGVCFFAILSSLTLGKLPLPSPAAGNMSQTGMALRRVGSYATPLCKDILLQMNAFDHLLQDMNPLKYPICAISGSILSAFIVVLRAISYP